MRMEVMLLRLWTLLPLMLLLGCINRAALSVGNRDQINLALNAANCSTNASAGQVVVWHGTETLISRLADRKAPDVEGANLTVADVVDVLATDTKDLRVSYIVNYGAPSPRSPRSFVATNVTVIGMLDAICEEWGMSWRAVDHSILIEQDSGSSRKCRLRPAESRE